MNRKRKNEDVMITKMVKGIEVPAAKSKRPLNVSKQPAGERRKMGSCG